MPCEAQHVDMHVLYIDRKHAGRLGCIYHEQKAMLMGNLAHSAYMDIITRQIGSIRTYDHLGIRRNRIFNIRQINRTPLIRSYDCKPDASAFHFIERPQY